jgi:PAS domain S-box-containing protein
MASDLIANSENQIVISEAEYRDLRESQRMLATLLGNLPGMAYRCANRPGLPFEFVSEGCVALTGYSAQQFLSGEISWQELVDASVLERTRRLTARAVKDRRPYEFVYPITTSGGERCWLWEQGQGIFDDDGMLRAYEGFVTDVTDRVEAHSLLESSVAERTRELETMLDVSRSVASILELEPLFDTIIAQIRRVIDCNAISIGVVDGDFLNIVAGWRDETGMNSQTAIGLRFPVEALDPFARQPVYTPDVRGDDEIAIGFRARVGPLLDTVYAHVCSWMAAPLIARDRLIGVFFVTSVESDHYSQRDIDLAMATANQIAIAVDNARLHEQARRFAALEERQRLARELHDSVVQALFGITLGAQTGLAALERNPAQLGESLRYIRELADVGLTEMRALIFELRPESLAQEGLVRAIEKQAAAIGARHRIDVLTDLCTEPDTPFAVKEALYRIAQEAMHNAIKHAKPTRIELCLARCDRTVTLTVSDDGIGFDTSATFPGHLGLVSMPERARLLGGDLTITSAPNAGTHVRAVIPVMGDG